MTADDRDLAQIIGEAQRRAAPPKRRCSAVLILQLGIGYAALVLGLYVAITTITGGGAQ